MQVILEEQQYKDLLKYKEAVKSNRHLIKYESWGMGGSITMAHTHNRNDVLAMMEGRISELKVKIEQLEARKWWEVMINKQAKP
jgi:hypothetical protein